MTKSWSDLEVELNLLEARQVYSPLTGVSNVMEEVNTLEVLVSTAVGSVTSATLVLHVTFTMSSGDEAEQKRVMESPSATPTSPVMSTILGGVTAETTGEWSGGGRGGGVEGGGVGEWWGSGGGSGGGVEGRGGGVEGRGGVGGVGSGGRVEGEWRGRGTYTQQVGQSWRWWFEVDC